MKTLLVIIKQKGQKSKKKFSTTNFKESQSQQGNLPNRQLHGVVQAFLLLTLNIFHTLF